MHRRHGREISTIPMSSHGLAIPIFPPSQPLFYPYLTSQSNILFRMSPKPAFIQNHHTNPPIHPEKTTWWGCGYVSPPLPLSPNPSFILPHTQHLSYNPPAISTLTPNPPKQSAHPHGHGHLPLDRMVRLQAQGRGRRQGIPAQGTEGGLTMTVSSAYSCLLSEERKGEEGEGQDRELRCIGDGSFGGLRGGVLCP